jgi:hypothetical protein
MKEYQRYQKSGDIWIDIYNCPIKLFRKKYPRCKTRVKPEEVVYSAFMVMTNRFLIVQ